MQRWDLDIKILELVLVLGGRRDGQRVEVEGNEDRTVTHPEETEDQFNNPEGMRLLHGKREAIDAGQDQNEDGQGQDEEFEQPRFDHVNGIEVHGSSEEDKKREHKHSNPHPEFGFLVRVSQTDQVEHGKQHILNQQQVQADQAAQFDFLEDCHCFVLLDALEEEDVVGE